LYPMFEHRAWLALLIAIAAASGIALISAQSDSMYIANELVWFPGSVEAGQVWRLLTHAFILLEPLALVFTLLILWFILPQVEEAWGSARVLLFFLAASCLAAGSAMLLGHISPSLALPYLAGPGAALLGFIYTYGNRNPDQTFFLLFVIPIRARWFALGYIAIRIVLSGGGRYALVLTACECAGASLALLLLALARAIGKKRAAERRRRLTVVQEDSGLLCAHAELLARFEKEKDDGARSALLAGEAGKSFSFTVCAPGDFRPRDRYCQACAAFGHCLGRLHSAGRADDLRIP